MAGDFQRPKLGNQIKQDVPGMYDLFNLLAVGNLTLGANCPVGSLNYSVNGSGQLTIQQLTSDGAWNNITKLLNDADTVDGFHASTQTTKETIVIRDSNGAVPGSITGNAPTATKAGELSEINPVAMGGTGASNAADARSNLGVPPIDHASPSVTYGIPSDVNYGHAKASSTLPKATTSDGTIGNEVTTFSRGDHQHPYETHYGVCETAIDTAAKVLAVPHFVFKAGAFVTFTYNPATSRSTTAEDGTVTTTALTTTTDVLTLSVNNTTAKVLKGSGGDSITGVTLIAGESYIAVYDGTNYVLISDCVHKHGDETIVGIKAFTNELHCGGKVQCVQLSLINGSNTHMEFINEINGNGGGFFLEAGLLTSANTWFPITAFPSGTSMLFAQTYSPVGWVLQTNLDDYAIRLSGGTGGATRGNTSFQDVFQYKSGSCSVGINGGTGGTTLDSNYMANHNHHFGYAANLDWGGGDGGEITLSGGRTGARYTDASGSQWGHSHSVNISGTATIGWNQYVHQLDVIRCNKA